MKKSFMNNIKHFVDSNVRQRIDRVAHNNNDFFTDDLLLVERQFECLRHICTGAEKRISTLLQSIQSSPSLGAYTHNVQAGLNSLSHNIAQATTSATSINSNSNQNATTNLKLSNLTHQQQQATIKPNTSISVDYSTSGNVSSQQHVPSITKSAYDKQKSSNISNISQRYSIQTDTNTISANSNNNYNDNNPSNQLSEDVQQRHKKLPIVGFLKFLVKSCYKLKPDSLLATTLTHCSQLQTQITKLYLLYEEEIGSQCLKPIQTIIEIDIPNVIKLRKLFIKSHNDLESVKSKYNGASQKQHQQQLLASHSMSSTTSYTITPNSAQQTHQTNNKLDQLKKELDDAVTRFEQARDTYVAELYAFVCRETELVDLLKIFYRLQAEYHQQVGIIIQNSLPALDYTLALTPRKVVFGTSLDDHLNCTGRNISPVIEICVHLLYRQGLKEEGLFRVPGSSVKIKRLKNAINAWFVTLANRNDLENCAEQPAGHNAVLAIHDLFKNILGHTPQQLPNTNFNNQSAATAITTTTTRDESTLTQNNLSAAQQDHHPQHQQLIYDVHSVAGLLKLYLRELPEPLLTYALYQDWIDACIIKTTIEDRLDALNKVIEQLPKSNYNNLKHLIRFLHLLTCHRDSNKMTSANLAITMAPSLIWSEPVSAARTSNESPQSGGMADVDDMQTMSMQMSSVGMSASLHAHIMEALIDQAESLFPDPVDFTLPDFSELQLNPNKDKVVTTTIMQDRSLKSTSPTGLSTASSSSFSSSTSSSSANKTTNKQHNAAAKTCSMEAQGGAEIMSSGSGVIGHKPPINRPVSMHFQREKHHNLSSLGGHTPPPIPPAPAIRSHARQASIDSQSGSARIHFAPSQKPPAPPVPTTISLKGESTSETIATINKQQQAETTPTPITPTNQTLDHQRLAYQRGAPALSSLNSSVGVVAGNNLNVARPSVPPPDRPHKLAVSEEASTSSFRQQASLVVSPPPVLPRAADHRNAHGQKPDEPDSRSSHSLTSSGILRADFEEISAEDIDDEIGGDISGPTSLNSLSGGDGVDDSSFDDNDSTAGRSWAHCGAPTIGASASGGGGGGGVGGDKKLTSNTMVDNSQASAESQAKPPIGADTETSGGDCASPSEVGPPTKPPRNISPKITQSTSL